MKNKPEITMETIKRMEDMSWFTHAQIFDDLLIVAQKETNCFIWRTAAGLVVFDGIWPDERVYIAIRAAIHDAGWDQEKIVKYVMTHGHIDHVGCGKWLVDNHRVTTYLSKPDDELRLAQPHEENRSDCWKAFKIDGYLHDGDEIDCGDKSIKVIGTPGHTPGCMSFVFPVDDCGEKHLVALFGGATPPWNDIKGKQQQIESVEKFRKAVKSNHVDTLLTNHTAMDNGLERIAYSKARMSFLPNIYVLGEVGAQKFCDVFRAVAE